MNNNNDKKNLYDFIPNYPSKGKNNNCSYLPAEENPAIALLP